MTLLTNEEVDARILALESTVSKQQAEINRLIEVNNQNVGLLLQIQAAFNQIAAGSKDGL